MSNYQNNTQLSSNKTTYKKENILRKNIKMYNWERQR